jgi:hypothetical protein
VPPNVDISRRQACWQARSRRWLVEPSIARRAGSLAKGSKKRSFSPRIGTQPLFKRFMVAILVGVAVMLNLLLNHSPPFVLGELMLALSLGLFGVALVEAVREKYAIRVLAAMARDRSTH